jgi:DNA-binding transcriptional ArsR family regulator
MEKRLIPCLRALSDPTRLGMVERLARGPASLGDLAVPLGPGLPTMLKHLKLLEEGGLVSSTKAGRQRMCRLNPAALQPVQHWLSALATTWGARLDRMEALAESLDHKETRE